MAINDTNPMDDLPDDDPRLDDPAFVGTDEGQAALAKVAAADREARKRSRPAKAPKAEPEPNGSGPVEIVRAADKGKPTAAARASRSGKPKASRGKSASGATRRGSAAGAKQTRRASGSPKGEAEPKAVSLRGYAPLPLGDVPVDVDGVAQYPILGKDGAPLPRYQKDNWIWKCPSCGRRLRNADCSGPEGGSHPKVEAPAGYRREARMVRGEA